MDYELLSVVGTIGTFLGFGLVERLLPGYGWPRKRFWVARGVGWFVAAFALSITVPMLTDRWIAAHSLLDLSGIGAWGIIPGVLVYQLLGYAWHRALHGVPLLWRLHQMHHSSERLDVWSQFRFHPLDYVGWTVVTSVSSIGILGLSLNAAVLTALASNALALFGHANLRTPRWLGFLVARPENHMLHHARGIHRSNYADLPIIDMVFGTFENPETAPAEVGFWDGASGEIGGLLLGRDMTRPPARRAEQPERAAA